MLERPKLRAETDRSTVSQKKLVPIFRMCHLLTWCTAGKRRRGRTQTQNRRCVRSCRSKGAGRRRRKMWRWPTTWQKLAMAARGSASSEKAPQTDRPGCQTGCLQDQPETKKTVLRCCWDTWQQQQTILLLGLLNYGLLTFRMISSPKK